MDKLLGRIVGTCVRRGGISEERRSGDNRGGVGGGEAGGVGGEAAVAIGRRRVRAALLLLQPTLQVVALQQQALLLGLESRAQLRHLTTLPRVAPVGE